MPQFSYKASNSQGEISYGTITKNDKQAAVNYLRSQNLFPLEVSDLRPEIAQQKAQKGLVKRKDLLTFTRQMASLLKSGVQVDRALLICAELYQKKPLGDVLKGIWQEVQAGKALSEALREHPSVFPVFYQNMIKSGEHSGALALVTDRLASFLEEEYELRLFLWSSLLYPVMVLAISLSAAGVIVFYVIPKFESTFNMLHRELPILTRVILAFSAFLRGWWWVGVIILMACAAGFLVFLRKPRGQLKLDWWRLKFPVLGDLHLKIQTARLARTLSTMLAGGVPILKALAILQESTTNRILAQALGEVRKSLREGSSMAAEMRKQGVFPTAAVHLLAIGEEASDIEGMAEKLARLYDAEVKNTLRALLSILEPAIILTLAVGIFFMLLSILIPVIQMSDI